MASSTILITAVCCCSAVAALAMPVIGMPSRRLYRSSPIKPGLEIRVVHYPPYCSKHNPIEHWLLPHIMRVWPMPSFSYDCHHQAIHGEGEHLYGVESDSVYFNKALCEGQSAQQISSKLCVSYLTSIFLVGIIEPSLKKTDFGKLFLVISLFVANNIVDNLAFLKDTFKNVLGFLALKRIFWAGNGWRTF